MEAQERGFSERKLNDLRAIYREVQAIWRTVNTGPDVFRGYAIGNDRLVDAVYSYVVRVDLSGFQHRTWAMTIMHAPELCVLNTPDMPCCIHRPSMNHMRDWPHAYDADESCMYRVCEHEAWHPDLDHLAYIAARFDNGHAAHLNRHECCEGKCCEGLVA